MSQARSLLSRLHYTNGDVSVSVLSEYGSTSSVSSILEIDGRRYSLTDPNAVNTMPVESRITFWSLCSDEAKNSDLYRKYASTKLTEAGIVLESIPEPYQLFIVNKASDLAALGQELRKFERNWFKVLFNPEDKNYVLFLKNADNIGKLIKGFIELDIANPIATIKKINSPYLELILSKSYDCVQLLQNLKKIGCRNPLESILAIESHTLEVLIANQHYFTEVMGKFNQRGFDGYAKFLTLTDDEREFLVHNSYYSFEVVDKLKALRFPNPFDKFMAFETGVKKLLMENSYYAFEVINKLKALNYPNPFDKFMAFEPSVKKFLMENSYYAFELIGIFKRFGYQDPLQTLLNLDDGVLALFIKSTYATNLIMEALYKSGKYQPIEFMLKLGNKAIATMLSSHDEFVKRINRGEDMEKVFLVTAKVVNKYSPILQAFIDHIGKKESNETRIANLNVVSKSLKQCRDSKTKHVANIPVRLEGDLFDLKTLTDLPTDAQGYRSNPLSNEKFLLSDLQPAKDIQKKIEHLIEKAESHVQIAKLTI